MNILTKLSLLFSASLISVATLAGLHPDIVMLDVNGSPVSASGMAMSTQQTCGDCHDTGFIAKNHDHPPHIASNCLLCHSENYDAETYFSTRQSPHASWAAISGFTKTPLVEWDGEQWQWLADTFPVDDKFSAERLGIKASDSEVCAQCHGIVHNSSEPLSFDVNDSLGRLTRKEGVIFSGQRLSDSALSIVGNADLNRTFDVHAERLVECTDCHRAANNPVHGGAHGSNLSHLVHDPRQADLADFLERPDHNLIIGVAGGDGNCKGCHEPEENHSEWLPEVAEHFEALTCQACHITELFGPARELVDNSVRNREGESLVVWRGVDSQTQSISGFKPLLLQRPEDGKFAPYNISLTRFWRDALTNTSVPMDIVSQAWVDAALPPATAELQWTDGSLDAMKAALTTLGIKQPELSQRLEKTPINHGVSRDNWAQKDCDACHSENGVFQQQMPLAGSYSGFVPPASASNDMTPVIEFVTGEDNRLYAVGQAHAIHELSRSNPSVLIAGSVFGLLGIVGFWQWFKRNRR